MVGYRVAAADEHVDPLAVDERICETQRFKQRLFVHVAGTLITLGVWLPGLVVWLISGRRSARDWAAGYRVQIERGSLRIGTESEARTVPLDAIVDLGVKDGYVNVAVRGSNAVQILGLKSPSAAIGAILDARDEHLRSLRSDTRDQLVEAESQLERDITASRSRTQS